MIIRNIEEITNKALYNAVLFLTNMHNGNRYHFVSLYVDPLGGCDITIEGKVSELDVQWFFTKLDNTNYVEYDYDYTYRNNNTEIFTRDNWKYEKE